MSHEVPWQQSEDDWHSEYSSEMQAESMESGLNKGILLADMKRIRIDRD